MENKIKTLVVPPSMHKLVSDAEAFHLQAHCLLRWLIQKQVYVNVYPVDGGKWSTYVENIDGYRKIGYSQNYDTYEGALFRGLIFGLKFVIKNNENVT